MHLTVTAVGPDNRGLADPLVHFVTGIGANIHEIQMYDHDSERLFAMLLRIEIDDPGRGADSLRTEIAAIGRQRGLSTRVWTRDGSARRPRLAICTTYRTEPATALLAAMADGRLNAAAAVMLGNRPAGAAVAEQYGCDWHLIGDERGEPDEDRFDRLIDEYDVDYIVLARYMRVLPARTCWQFAGGRIINLHHGLLPPFPGFQPYEDAYRQRMLAYGATVHFIIPDLDAGNQIIHQATFTVPPGMPLDEIKSYGETTHEPNCLVEGVRRVVDREVELHFHRVVGRADPGLSKDARQ